jgi:hypothetical protein
MYQIAMANSNHIYFADACEDALWGILLDLAQDWFPDPSDINSLSFRARHGIHGSKQQVCLVSSLLAKLWILNRVQDDDPLLMQVPD